MSIETTNLHSLKVGEILDRAFQLYRKNFWLFIGITGILLVPILIVEVLSQYFFSNVIILSYIETILTVYILNGAMLWAASRTYFGHSVFIADAYRDARRFIGAFFMANLIQALAYLPLGIVLVVVMMLFAGNLTIGVILVIPIIIVLSTRWGVVLPAIVSENLGGSDAMKRSWSLTKGEFWHTFGTLFASVLLTYLVILLPNGLITYFTELFSIPLIVGTMLSLILAQVGQILAIPLSLSIQMILYYDLRVRREGYDLELALQATTKDDQEEEIPA